MNSQTPASDFQHIDHGPRHLGNYVLPRLLFTRRPFLQLFCNLMVLCFAFIAILPLVSIVISDSHTRLRAEALVTTCFFFCKSTMMQRFAPIGHPLSHHQEICLKNCLAKCFNFALQFVAYERHTHTARPHWLPASVRLADGTDSFWLEEFHASGQQCSLVTPLHIHSLCGHARSDYCKCVRHSSVDWKVMCLSRELDFEKFTTAVDRVPQSFVRLWVHEDMRGLQSAWWRFCSDAHGLYILEEDGAWIGQPGRETVHFLLRSEVVLPAAPQAPPNGETTACCVGVGRVEARTWRTGRKVGNTLNNCYFFLRRN